MLLICIGILKLVYPQHPNGASILDPRFLKGIDFVIPADHFITLTVILRTFPYGNMVEDWSYFSKFTVILVNSPDGANVS